MIPFDKLLKSFILSLLHARQLHHIIFRCHCPLKLLCKFLAHLLECSDAPPRKLPVPLTCTNGSVRPEYLRSGKRKSLEMTGLIISSERGDSPSSIICQPSTILYPCMSFMIWASLHTSSFSYMARPGLRAATWSRSCSMLWRCCRSSLSSAFTALSLLLELCLLGD